MASKNKADDLLALHADFQPTHAENGLQSPDASDEDLLLELSAETLGIRQKEVRVHVAYHNGMPVVKRLPIQAIDVRQALRHIQALTADERQRIYTELGAIRHDLLTDEQYETALFGVTMSLLGLRAPVCVKYEGNVVWDAGNPQQQDFVAGLLGLIATFPYPLALDNLSLEVSRLSEVVEASREERLGNS